MEGPGGTCHLMEPCFVIPRNIIISISGYNLLTVAKKVQTDCVDWETEIIMLDWVMLIRNNQFIRVLFNAFLTDRFLRPEFLLKVTRVASLA